jgi:hypothetical protein
MDAYNALNKQWYKDIISQRLKNPIRGINLLSKFQ